MTTIKTPRLLTGDTPTGRLHLGHWVGSLENRVALQNQYDCYFIIANVHAFTTRMDRPDDIRQSEGYAISLKIRKRIEEVFGWMKTVGGMRKLKLTGREKASGQFRFVAAIYNLVRIGSLTGWCAGSHT